MKRTRLVLDRSTVVILAAGLVMLQVLIFSAGFLVGAAEGVQVLTPPEPPREEIRLASFAVSAIGEGRGGGLAPAVVRQDPPKQVSRPSPLDELDLLLPPPPAKPRATPARKATPRLPRTAEAYAAMICEAAERHSLSPALVEAVARIESGFNPRALSHKGARGLMQVIPATGRRFGVRSDKLFDPEHNLKAGVAYLAWLSKRYDGNLDFILAAYNAGEGAVDDHGGIPPYRETRDYVKRVKAALRKIEEKALAEEPQSALGDPPQARVGEALQPGT